MPLHIPKDTVSLLAKVPAIPARRRDLTELYARLESLLVRSPRTNLLSILKYATFIVLLCNFGSLPFVWHSESHRSPFPFFHPSFRDWDTWRTSGLTRSSVVRVFWPIILAKLKLKCSVLRLKLAFASKKERTRALIAWGESLSPVGANPFGFDTVYRRWASASFNSMKIHFRADSCDLLNVFPRYRRYRHVRDAPQ